jgi:hypothetical protein
MQAAVGDGTDLAEAVCKEGGEDEHDEAALVHRAQVPEGGIRSRFRLLEVILKLKY